MTWEIMIPFRDRTDSLVDVAIDARTLADPEDRATTRALVMGAQLEDGLQTAGQLIDRLEAAGPDERRRLLDRARVAAGLERSEDIDRREQFRLTQEIAARNSSGRDAEGKALLGCAAEGCSALPMDATGLLVAVADRVWWCAAHRHLAGPEDHLPPTDIVTIGPHFELIPAPSVQRQMQAQDERRRAEDELRAKERAAEAEVIRAAHERFVREHEDDLYVNPLAGPGWRAAP